MLDHELAAALEEVGEREAAAGRVEGVGLGHLQPRLLAAALGDAITEAGEFFFLAQQLEAGGQPFFGRGHGGLFE